MSNTALWYRQQHSTVLFAHLTNGRLHVQLLQHRVHVTRRSCIAQTHKPTLRSANDGRMELEGKEGGGGRGEGEGGGGYNHTVWRCTSQQPPFSLDCEITEVYYVKQAIY